MLGIYERFLALAVESADYRRLLGQGCRWLDDGDTVLVGAPSGGARAPDAACRHRFPLAAGAGVAA